MKSIFYGILFAGLGIACMNNAGQEAPNVVKKACTAITSSVCGAGNKISNSVKSAGLYIKANPWKSTAATLVALAVLAVAANYYMEEDDAGCCGSLCNVNQNSKK